ncbi:MAG: hypothetical protein U1F15_01940 [Burkholderiales bacterium]
MIIDEVVSRVRAIDGTTALAPETVRALIEAVLPAVRTMLDHDKRVKGEGALANGYADRMDRGPTP